MKGQDEDQIDNIIMTNLIVAIIATMSLITVTTKEKRSDYYSTHYVESMHRSRGSFPNDL